MEKVLDIKFQEKLIALEKDLAALKKASFFTSTKKIVSLKGFLKGINIGEDEIAAAKKSLFRRMAI